MDFQLINDIVKKFINQQQINDYIGIIVYGSYVYGYNNELSDLDIMVIKREHLTSDCGSTIIENVRVEFFIQDIKKLYNLVKDEISNNNPSHLTKFYNSIIIFDKTGEVKKFINFAKKIYETKINKQYTDEEKFAIFSINNRLEDLQSLIGKVNFYSVYFDLIERIRNTYSKINGIIELPLTKIDKIYTDKNFGKKYIGIETHILPDDEFIKLYLECLKLDNQEQMVVKVLKLYQYSFSNLDFNPENFILRFAKKPPFRV